MPLKITKPNGAVISVPMQFEGQSIRVGIGADFLDGSLGAGPDTPPFNPATLFAASEQGVWYDPSDLSTMFQDTAGTIPVTAAEQLVARINDKSGNGHHATQATLSRRPTYRTTGSAPFHYLDFGSDFMTTPTITPGTDKMQAFLAATKRTSATQIYLESSSTVDTNNGSFHVAGLTGPTQFVSKGTVLAATSGGSLTYPSTNIITGLGDISADSAVVRIDGTQVASTTTDQGTGNYLAHPIYIGARAGSSLFFGGAIFGVVVRFGPVLTSGQLADMENYMASKIGVTL